MHEYLFDLSLFASLRVRASSEAEARRMIRESIDCNTANLGAWPNGDPIIAEVSTDDDSRDGGALISIDDVEA